MKIPAEACIAPLCKYENEISFAFTKWSLFESLGFLYIIFISECSYANDMAGTKSQPMSMHNIKTEERGKGSWNTIKNINGIISGILDCKV